MLVKRFNLFCQTKIEMSPAYQSKNVRYGRIDVFFDSWNEPVCLVILYSPHLCAVEMW